MRGPVSFLHDWDPAGKQSLRVRPEGPCFGEAESVYWRWHRTLSSVGSERTPHTRKVAGSTPAASTNTFVYGIRLHAEVFAAQEIPNVNLRVCWGTATKSSTAGASLQLLHSRHSLLECSHLFSCHEIPSRELHAETNWDEIVPLFPPSALTSPVP